MLDITLLRKDLDGVIARLNTRSVGSVGSVGEGRTSPPSSPGGQVRRTSVALACPVFLILILAFFN